MGGIPDRQRCRSARYSEVVALPVDVDLWVRQPAVSHERRKSHLRSGMIISGFFSFVGWF